MCPKQWAGARRTSRKRKEQKGKNGCPFGQVFHSRYSKELANQNEIFLRSISYLFSFHYVKYFAQERVLGDSFMAQNVPSVLSRLCRTTCLIGQVRRLELRTVRCIQVSGRSNRTKRKGVGSHYPTGFSKEAGDRGKNEEEGSGSEVDVGVFGARGYDAAVLCA